ncbi:MAG: response regulator [Thermosipho sp. (in: Bacteria)]|nr:response regulator [Thermosipho sp. (in: thermotogales)]
MKKILIVDDSKMARNYHAYVLKNAGYRVIEAIDGADALEKLFSNPDISCIITDLNMPNMDGLTFIKKVREKEEFKKIPIIIVTTLDENYDKSEGFKAGANYYLIKPTKPSTLISTIKLLLKD